MTIRVSFSNTIVRVAVEINGAIESLITEIPDRTWVGLTDDEIFQLHGFYDYMTPEEFVSAIKGVEAKLKEKNSA